MFKSLLSAYSDRLQLHLQRSQGQAAVKKGDFWSLFKPAWEASFTKEHILKAFEATGVNPLNPDTELLRHENEGLRESAEPHSKRHKHKGPLDLQQRKEYEAEAMYYSPRKIREAEVEMKQLRESAKLLRAKEAEERKVERERLKKVREKEKAEKAAEREAQKRDRDAKKSQQQRQKRDREDSKSRTRKPQAKKRRVGGAAGGAAEEVAAPAPLPTFTRRGRTINTPGRFR
ncbi:hypothetical protein EJ07DRAFT_96026 [Lizonia empirigonia]|nr:hypothetical protein EJ07DRAFT_96026 [Lizonia empirigonia]